MNGACDGQKHSHGGVHVQGPLPVDHGPQVRAVDQVHCQKDPRTRFPGIEEGDDVVVTEFLQNAEFAPETFPGAEVVGQAFVDHLEGYKPVVGCVPGPVYRAHTALTQEFLKLVRADFGPRPGLGDGVV